MVLPIPDNVLEWLRPFSWFQVLYKMQKQICGAKGTKNFQL